MTLLPGLPRTSSGKIDRRALPALPKGLVTDPADSSSTAMSDVEMRVAEIWAGVLGQRPARRDDDFFELGGHSLAAVQVLARARRAFGVDLPLRSVFDAPTVGQFAAIVASTQTQRAGPEAAPLK